MLTLNISKFLVPLSFLLFGLVKGFSDSDNYLFENNHPSYCKSNEYFDANSFMCIECDHNKNLEPSEDGIFYLIVYSLPSVIIILSMLLFRNVMCL